ncbi:MAG: tRNA (adenine-N1)-methyltransferase, partial [Nitrospira sp.]
PNLVSLRKSAYEGIELLDDGVAFDRVVLDLPEPWQVVPHAAKALRSGGIYLSFVPTVPQVVQTVEALERAKVFGMVETFESLIRTWSVLGRSVRPDHRMVAHSGFITVARKVEPGLLAARRDADSADASSSEGLSDDNNTEESDS